MISRLLRHKKLHLDQLSGHLTGVAPPRGLHREVRAKFLRLSGVEGGNFSRVSARDLELAFSLVDDAYFCGALKKATGENLSFRLSERMTSSGGKLSRKRSRRKWECDEFEIAISSHLLFFNFVEGETEVVNGVQCRDRLDALLRIMEHEALHLAETLLRGKSSCRGEWFKEAAKKLFGHSETAHRLPTLRAVAHREMGLTVGSLVKFQLGRKTLSGTVNRITKRATVLVGDPSGVLYSDGMRYIKYYVPLDILSQES